MKWRGNAGEVAREWRCFLGARGAPGDITAVTRQPEPAPSGARTLEAGALETVAAALPGYQILREIHRGGQGVVYQAIQNSTGSRVAIKVMREGPFAGAADRARFEREVRVLGQLGHPNIVAIHDSGIAAGCYYLVVDYVSGLPLDQFVHSRWGPEYSCARPQRRWAARGRPNRREECSRCRVGFVVRSSRDCSSQ